MKNDIESLLSALHIKEILLKGGNENYDKQIDYCINQLKAIDNVYRNASTENKQHIIGSIFPERLIFEKNKYRTPILNRVVSLICNNNGLLKGKKKESTFLTMYFPREWSRQESNLYLEFRKRSFYPLNYETILRR